MTHTSLKYNQVKQLIIITTTLTLSILGGVSGLAAGNKTVKKLYNHAISIDDLYPDSAEMILHECLHDYEISNDTIGILECKIKLSDIEKNKGDYSLAYDYAWQALIVAEEYKDLYLEAEANKMLGMLYGIFSNHSQTMYYLNKSLSLRKNLYSKGNYKEEELIPSYYSLAVQSSHVPDYTMALLYLDTCFMIASKHEIDLSYIKSQQGFIYMKQGKIDTASTLFEQVLPYFIDNKLRFQIMIYSFLGEANALQLHTSKAIRYYEECLSAMSIYNTHTDIKPEVLDALADLYRQQGDISTAYNILNHSKALNDSLFSARNNGDLLEVKNQYNDLMAMKNEKIATQNKLLQKKNQSNFRLKTFLGIMILFILVGILIGRNHYQKKQFDARQKKAKLLALHEKEKIEQIVNIKNKEITSYTLRLIDKERIIGELLTELKTHIDNAAFRRIRNSTQDVNKNLWVEFNERFTKVNAGFYKRLLEQYPQLSPTDLKHCALIKLHFNGKEMAQLLNISLPSVHLARHRLRKKLELKREDNLGQFINGI